MNKHKKTKNNFNSHTFNLCITFLILIFSFLFLSMDWPSEDAVLIRNFGVNDSGMPVLGMVFSGGTGITAAERGEVIFTHSRKDSASRLPSPLGAWTAIDHGDGLISVYSRYADPEDGGQALPYTYLEKNRQIALPGISGWSSRDGFNFMIIDRKERRWVNPAMIITPVQKLQNPQIRSVELVNASGQTVSSRSISQGRYTVLVNTFSSPLVTETSGINMTCQKITSLVNGAETASLNFESFSARDGKLMVYRNGLIPARQVYSAYPSYEASEVFFTRGQAVLEIIVQDIAGNSSSSIIRFTVN